MTMHFFVLLTIHLDVRGDISQYKPMLGVNNCLSLSLSECVFLLFSLSTASVVLCCGVKPSFVCVSVKWAALMDSVNLVCLSAF